MVRGFGYGIYRGWSRNRGREMGKEKSHWWCGSVKMGDEMAEPWEQSHATKLGQRRGLPGLACF